MAANTNVLGEKFLAWIQSAEGRAELTAVKIRTKKIIQHLRQAQARDIDSEKWRKIHIRSAA